MNTRALLVLIVLMVAASCRSEPDRVPRATDDNVAASAGAVQGQAIAETAAAAQDTAAQDTAAQDTAAQDTAVQDTTEQDPTLALGDSIYRTWCTSCHTAFPPESKPASQWFGTVRKMQQIAEAQGHETLTQEQLFAVTDYLEAEAEGGE